MLLGHSFIRRLNEHMKNTDGDNHLRLDPMYFKVICRAQGGLTVPILIHERPDLYDFSVCQPDIVYLQIGWNDLSNTTSSESVANKIYSFAYFLHFDSTYLLWLLENFFFVTHLKLEGITMIKLWPPMCQSFRKDYNDKVVATNVSILQKGLQW